MLTIQTDELLGAIKAGNQDQVRRLASSDPKLLTATDKNGVTGIMYALYTGHAPIAQFLASSKENLDLAEASSLGRIDRVKQLIQKDPSLATSYSADGFSILALASYFGQRELVEYLIEKGAEVNAVAQNPTRFTALTGALSNNHREVAKILVRNGADVNYRYEQGFSPLMLAVENGNLDMTRFLLDHGAEVNAKTNEGKSALTYAQEKNQQEIAQLLRDSGAH